MLRRYSILILLLVITFSSLNAQERVTTFGIQFKPIVPSELFKTGVQEVEQNNVFFTTTPKFGYSFGMAIRKGLTKTLSLESGISYLNRGYELNIQDDDIGFSETSDFKLINYEIPVSLLVYIQLSRQAFMNVSGGVAMDMYPTDLFTYSPNFQNDVVVADWLRASLIANIGWEYRTEESGYFYIGGSYHRPFSYMAKEIVWYNGNDRNERVVFDLFGNYVTIDLRYFFHEDPEKKKRKTKNSKKTGKTK